MSDAPPDPRTAAFQRVLRGLLRPLVRALIAQGVTAPALYRLLKQLYVEVAEQSFRLDETPPTDSRISMLTGVHRRDVRAFRSGTGATSDEVGQRATTIATVLGRWLADPDMTLEDGAPRPLWRTGADGPSFERLVATVSRDIRPRTVLDELLRQGLVTLSEDGETVTLSADAFLGPADLDQKVFFFAENVGDHISAAVDNLLADEPRFMERAVFYNRLRASSVDDLEAQARDLGGDLLLKLNRLAHTAQAEDLSAEDGTERFRFGLFFYREDEAADGEDTTAPPRGTGNNE
ncbi:MAG: DUF6502 family protein [Pseudomonadota bacterium]